MSGEIARTAFYLALLLGAIYGSRWIENRWPIADVPHSEFRDDWLAVIVSVGLSSLLAPLAAIIAGTIARYTGLGWIHLPTEGYWWYASLAVAMRACSASAPTCVMCVASRR